MIGEKKRKYFSLEDLEVFIRFQTNLNILKWVERLSFRRACKKFPIFLFFPKKLLVILQIHKHWQIETSLKAQVKVNIQKPFSHITKNCPTILLVFNLQ